MIWNFLNTSSHGYQGCSNWILVSYNYWNLNCQLIIPLQWKALKCQTLGAAVHVIVLVCWLESIIVSWLSHACHAHSVLFLPMQSSLTSFWRFFIGLVQLIFSFPSWFHIWFYCSHTFHSFLSQITPCFSFGLKDMITAFTCLPSYRYSSFTLRAYLCWRHTYCQWPIIELAKNVSPKNKMAASHVVQIHTHAHFPRSKKWPTYHVAIPTGNTLASQQSIFRENRLKFSTTRRWG